MSKIKLNHSSGNSMSIGAPATDPGGALELKLPATVGSANQVVANSSTPGTLAFANLPINEFDFWYLTTALTSDGDLTSNLARNNQAGAASQIGTGMTESSGIFTFPSTGKYLIFVQASFVIAGPDNVALDTMVTTNNSSYSTHSRATDGAGSGTRTGGSFSMAFVDVTDTSQVKVKFNLNSLSGGELSGNANYITTGFVFIRLGDT